MGPDSRAERSATRRRTDSGISSGVRVPSPVAVAAADPRPPARGTEATTVHRSPTSLTLPPSRPARISSRQKSGFPSLSSNARRASSGCTDPPPRLPTMSGSMSDGPRGPSARSTPPARWTRSSKRRAGSGAGSSSRAVVATRIDACIRSATTRSRSSSVEASSHGTSSIASTSGRSRATSASAHASASRRAARSAKVIVPCSVRPGATAAIPLRAGSLQVSTSSAASPSASSPPIGP